MMKIGRIVPSIFAMFIFTYFGKVIWDFPGGSLLKNLPANLGDGGDMDSIPGQEDPLEEAMATHSRILACKIPWTEELGRLQFIGSRRVGHD